MTPICYQRGKEKGVRPQRNDVLPGEDGFDADSLGVVNAVRLRPVVPVQLPKP